jgi:hypothetical protein
MGGFYSNVVLSAERIEETVGDDEEKADKEDLERTDIRTK